MVYWKWLKFLCNSFSTKMHQNITFIDTFLYEVNSIYDQFQIPLRYSMHNTYKIDHWHLVELRILYLGCHVVSLETC